MVGGYDGKKPLDDVQSLNITSKKWEALPVGLPSPSVYVLIHPEQLTKSLSWITDITE